MLFRSVRIRSYIDMAQIDVGRNLFLTCAEHNQNGFGCCLARDSKSTGEQGFARDPHQLLRLAKAAAGSGGKNNCGHGHPLQFNSQGEIELDLRLPRLETETSRRKFL